MLRHTYLQISGKCNLSARAASNGLTMRGNRDGGVLQIVLNMCKGPFFRLIEDGVNIFVCSVRRNICCWPTGGESCFLVFRFGVLNMSIDSM